MSEAHYYPFGMSINALSYTNPLQKIANKYLHNDKELQDDLGLGWYDYGARFYDAEVPRFTTIDPLVEKFSFQSPYVYAGNNPIFFIDKNGEAKEDWFLTASNEYVYIDGATKSDLSKTLKGSGLTWVSSESANATMIRDGSVAGETHYAFTWEATKMSKKEFFTSNYNPIAKGVRSSINNNATKVTAATVGLPLAVVGSAELLAAGIIETEFWAGKAVISTLTQAITNKGNVDVWDVGVDAFMTPGASALFGGLVDITPTRKNPIRIVGMNKSIKETGIDISTELFFNKQGNKAFNSVSPYLKNLGEKRLLNTVIGLPMNSLSKSANYILKVDGKE
jgi:RHS repeat-associated protein